MIKVLIERVIADDLEKNYQDAIRSTLKEVLDATGYISGESLTDIDNPNHKFIVTNWTSVQAWNKWSKSQKRLDALNKVYPILMTEEKITVLEIH
jgi:heme-degrading monooxygenase HmoA